jgi:hypothetical protein
MSALIEPPELASYMRRPTLDADPALIVACELASGMVRDWTQQDLSAVKDDTFTWILRPYLRDPSTLLLPQVPVTDVSSVVRDGDTLAIHEDYEWDTAGLVVSIGTSRFYGTVVVTYDHGWDPIPEGLRAVTLAVGSRLYDNPSRDVNRAVGSHNESYTVDFTLNEQHVLGRYMAARA